MKESGSSSHTEAQKYLSEIARKVEGCLPPERGKLAATFVQLLHARTQPAYFAGRPEDLVVAEILDLFDFLDKPLDGIRVRVTPGVRTKAGSSPAALETVGRDQPFILDSLLELLRARGCVVREIFHPILAVQRTSGGELTSLGPPRRGAELAFAIRIELEEPTTEEGLQALAAEASGVLAEARTAVEDFEAMVGKLHEAEDALRKCSKAAASVLADRREEVDEIIAFIEWLERANFTFLGHRGYRLAGPGGQLEPEAEVGLGILRTALVPRLALADSWAEKRPLVLVRKSSAESRVLRRTRMDQIEIARLDAQGHLAGEDFFLGLFTARAYNDLPSDIPLLRRKLDEIIEKANVVRGSHDHKEIFSIFTSIPKSELFATEPEKISEMIFSAISASVRREIRVSFRLDALERGVSVMVLLPRDKFSSEARSAIQDLLARRFGGAVVDYRLALSDEPMARMHFYIATASAPVPAPSIDLLEAEVGELTRTWGDRLRQALHHEHEPEEARRLTQRYLESFPPAYVAQVKAEAAVWDIRHVEQALGTGEVQVGIRRDRAQQHGRVSLLMIYQDGEALRLSRLMPVLTHLGLQVLDEQTFQVVPRRRQVPDGDESNVNGSTEARPVFIHAFRVLRRDGSLIPAGKVAGRVAASIPRVLAGEAEDDPLNALVTKAGLGHHQVAILRAYDAYLHQLRAPWTQRTTYAALCDNPLPAACLVKLFEVRFDPHTDPASREALEQAARADFERAMIAVAGIHEDQILRFFEKLILATVRTNRYAGKPGGGCPPALALKLRCAAVPAMPEPRPLYEIFVHGPELEGVHLRSGKIARGGIRWSSRVDDYRMEILGLMRAQRTKNSVIVPVGAKGGFILKRAPQGAPPPDEVRRQYRAFIGALLDVTDNVLAGAVVHPMDVVVHDEDDPYLVVAADRGTATFSDVANEIAESRSFWLGDAFASGGSRGFNHKKEGITARGAWKLVSRHFREMGVDPQKATFTVAGIGDMSGDVFGNGMLLSRNMLLRAAFNHAHIFLDPDPDPAASFEERLRLFQLPASAWTDYDPRKISPGGGVYGRGAKSIELSPRAREVLAISKAVVNGEELVRAILKMPVDLLWNGGIGTYVKARAESHADVADPANDAVRVDAAELRARVAGEGGNLGFTQLARVEYARAGGRINTDFIDNSAGVDLSDHEVNLKILLALAESEGALSAGERDGILRDVEPQVCAQVLRDNHLQGLAVSMEERKGAASIDDSRLLIDELASEGLLNRAVEKIPPDEDLVKLRNSGLGLTRPEIAVLLAHAKISACAAILASDLPDDPCLEPFLEEYFPPAIVSRCGQLLPRHRLRREISTTAAVNAAVNEMGICFFHRTRRTTGAGFDRILRAYLIASRLAGTPALRASLDRLHAEGTADPEAIHAALAALAQAVQDATAALLRKDLPPEAEKARESGLEILAGIEKGRDEKLPALRTRLPAIPDDVLRGIVRAEGLWKDLELVELQTRSHAPFEAVVQSWAEAGASLLMDRVEAEALRVVRLSAEDAETCASLLERARAHQRTLASRMLEKIVLEPAGTDPRACRVSRIIPPGHPDRIRAAAILDAARSRAPLTPSGLFVLVEALGRIAWTVGTPEKEQGRR